MSDAQGHDDFVGTFRTQVGEYLDESVASGIACREFGSIMPPAYFDEARAWQRHCFASGFAGIDWPTEYGGRGLSAAHASIWFEECAQRAVAPYMNFQGFVLTGAAIRKFGTDEQKNRYLRGILAADDIWCQLFSEPGSGSDLVSLTTRAERTDTGWIVNGQKVWSSTAQLSDYGILLARTELSEPGHRGISFFLFDMHQHGVEVRPIKQMTGDHEFCEVFFTDAVLDESALLGELNRGWTVATSVLADERAEVGASGVVLQRRLAEVARGSSSGRPVETDRTFSLMTSGNSLGHLLVRSAGEPMLGPLTKLALTELDSEMTRSAIDGLGADGMLASDVSEAFLYAPGMRLAGGTSEIQRNLIGERLLGLPREPKAKS